MYLANLKFDEVPEKDDLIGTEESARRSGIPSIHYLTGCAVDVGCTCVSIAQSIHCTLL